MTGKPESTPREIEGRALRCPHCEHDRFWTRMTLMNTKGATFLGVEWANKEATNYVCGRCGYIFWFFEES